MRKISTTTWLLILVLLLGLGYFLKEYFAKPARSADYKAQLVDFQKDKLSMLRLTQGDRKAELSKISEDWKINLSHGKQVATDTAAVGALIDLLLRIRPGRIYAKTGKVWGKLALDTTGTRVEAFENKKKVLDLVVGRTESSPEGGQHTYVRLYEDSTSYVAPDVAAYSINPDPNSYRATILLSILPDSIQNIHFRDNETGLSLSLQNQDSVWAVDTAPAATIPKEDMQKYLLDMATLSSTVFDDEFSPTRQPTRSIRIASNTQEESVYFYTDEAGWLLQSSNYRDTFFRDSTAMQKIWKSSAFFLDMAE